jgi:hypothetical protein
MPTEVASAASERRIKAAAEPAREHWVYAPIIHKEKDHMQLFKSTLLTGGALFSPLLVVYAALSFSRLSRGVDQVGVAVLIAAALTSWMFWSLLLGMAVLGALSLRYLRK